MPETTIAELDDTTENFATYKCQDDNPITGTYVTREAAEQLGDGEMPEFLELIVGGDQGLTLSQHDESANYLQFQNMPYVKNCYISRDFLEEIGLGEPDEVTVAVSEASEEDWEDENEDEIDEEELDEFIWGETEDQSDQGSDSPTDTADAESEDSEDLEDLVEA